ncbi:MAG TPA: chloride channel protein [Acetobacteraceae bacterium]|nr:chloride channel protein [Acetobacteraceae bacterium]
MSFPQSRHHAQATSPPHRPRNLARYVSPQRWARYARVHQLRLRQRAMFVLGGMAIGLAGVVMALGATRAESLFSRLLGVWPQAPWVVTPLGFVLIAWLTRRFVPNAEGSGIPQAIAARALWSRQERGKLVSLWIGINKIFLTLAGLCIGASIGREGPTVQVGASIMFAIGRFSPARQPGLILAGASAGIAAAFNTPLAGVIFGIEEMSRSFDERANGLMIAAVVAAGIVSIAALGNYTYFGVTAATLHTAWGWAAVPVCGVVGGLAGGLFSRALVEIPRRLPGAWGVAIRRHPLLFALGCGFVVAVCGHFSDERVFGTGYEHVRMLLEKGGGLSGWFAPLKLIATAASSVAGIPGGLFSPSLAVGAGVGYDIWLLFPHASLGALVLLGMVGYFAGVVQAPITAFAIVAEMTADHSMIVPLMGSALIGSTASKLICPEGVYHILSRNYRRAFTGEAAMPAPGAAIALTPSHESG